MRAKAAARTAASIALLAGMRFGSAGFAKTDARLEFDAASVKPVSPGMNGYTVRFHGGPGTDDPTMFVCENMSLSNLINSAYGLNFGQLSAPDWANGAMFNVNARVPKGATYEQFQVMLQNLLADRFQLKVHRETSERAAYKLVVAKNGPKFKAAAAPPVEEPGEDSPPRAAEPKPFQLDAERYPAFGPGESGTRMSGNRARMVYPRMTMADFAGTIGAYVHAVVTDSTGLSGAYEISLSWVTGGMHAASTGEDTEGDPGPTLFQALQQQLGLRLVESSKVPVERLVVDHAEKVPAEN